MSEVNTEPLPQRCLHCGLPSGEDFCCSGCRHVYNFIHGLGLDDFYRLRDESQRPAAPRLSSFSHFDDPAFLERYATPLGEAERCIELHLDGMHCAACVWLVEKLPTLIDGVSEARANIAASSVVVRYGGAKLSAIAALLDSLGYTPHPLRADSFGAEKRRARQEHLLRLGVAAVAAMNTMLIAIALYQGWFSPMAPEFVRYLNVVSFILTVPAICYSAIPFYRAALGGLRARVLHIDLPIAAALLLAFWASVYNTFWREGEVYYDTVTMLIFLLLSARWVQRRGIDQADQSVDLFSALAPLSARRLSGGAEEEVYLASLAEGDRIAVRAGEVIAADGVVLEGESAVSLAVLTGEAEPVRVVPRSVVWAGARNISSPLIIEVQNAFPESRIGRLLAQLERMPQRAPIVSLTDRLSRYFVFGVSALAVLTALYWWSADGPAKALSVVLSLLIITCPCALGLSAPLALAVAVRRAARAGILVRSEDVLERLARSREVFLDKTATITEGMSRVRQVYFRSAEGIRKTSSADELPRDLQTAVRSLEAGSSHPVAGTLRAFCRGGEEKPGWETTEVLGEGVRRAGWFLGAWRAVERERPEGADEFRSPVKGLLAQGLSPVALVHGEVVAVFGIGDQVRPGMGEAVSAIRSAGRVVGILSGDATGVVQRIAAAVGVPSELARGEQTPEQKAEVLRSRSRAVMIGDGANDALALCAADVGVAVSGGAELSLRVADVFLARPEAQCLEELFRGADRTLGVIKTNLGISVLYNTLGAGLALGGYVNPLVAAVLMPLSSLSVVFTSAYARTFAPRWR